MIELKTAEAGVYRFEPDGTLTLIHRHTGEAYRLIDIVEFYELGETLEAAVDGLELDRREIKRLAALADQWNEEHPPGFAAMCRAVVLAASGVTGGAVRYFANFGG